MKKIYFSLLMACLSILSLTAIAQTTTYSTPGTYTFTVGTGYSAIAVDVRGAQGGSSLSSIGGKGGQVTAQIAVTTGQVLTINVGGVGGNFITYCVSSNPAGTNGGGIGWGYGGAGGGASDIRTGGTALANRIIVGGGGGGGGYNCGSTNGESGGAGGFPSGGIGMQCNTAASSLGGSGGTQTAGGVGATSYSCNPGTLGLGGAAPTIYCYSGGGGGGYYGGGSGAYGGGGGGSSYSGAGVTGAVYNDGSQTGNGLVTITPLPPTITSTPSSLAFGGVTSGTTSATSVFSLVGSSLTGASVTVTPPANFQISPDGATWYTSASPYTFTYSGNSFSNLFFAQFLPTALTAYSGNIAVTGGGISATLNIPVSGTGTAACSGTPTAGTATINGGATASGNSGTAFTLNVPSATVGGGITYQWQVSTTSASTGFSNIGGANTASYVYTGLAANSWFQCIVSCGASSVISSVVAATFTLPSSSCTPAFATTCSSYPMSTSINSLIGFSGSISDPGACGANYVDNSASMNVNLKQGTTYNISYGVSTTYYATFGVQLWIDFNDNGTFETSETVGGIAQPNITSAVMASTLAIPATATVGAHRMRVVGIYSPPSNFPGMPSCPTTAITYGNARDYKVTILPPTPTLNATPVAAFPNVTVGNSSVPVAFTALTGSGLAPTVGLLTVTAPTGFAVSTTGSTWASSAVVPYSGGGPNSANVYVQFTPTSASTFSGNLTVTGGGLPSALSVPVSGTGVTTACSGTPTAGTATISPASGGPTTSFTLSLSGASTSGDLRYQWQSSSDGGATWVNIAAGMYPSFQFTGLFANSQFRCLVSCAAGVTVISGAATGTYIPTAMAPSSCTPTFASASLACSTYSMFMRIQSLVGTSGSIADASACSGTGYENLTSTTSVSLSPGSTYSATLNTGPSYPGSMGAQVWIDFNNNGIFESSESVGGYGLSSTSSTSPVISLTIPSGLTAGVYRMRVVGNYNCCGATSYPAMNPCPTTAITYGDVRDYSVTILGGSLPCSSAKGGIVSAAPLTSCNSFASNLFNVGESAGASGLSYQWQSSTSPSSGFTNISGATNAAYIPTVSSVGTIYFRDSTRCANTGAAAVSTSLGLTLNPAPTAITGTMSICAGVVTTLTSSPLGGTWSTSNAAVATVSGTGVLTGVSTGNANITYTLPTGCITVATITVNPQPTAITGPSSICGSLSATLSAGPAGGTWGSSNITVATIGATSGVVTGGAAGTVVITYTLPTGCSSSMPMTVNALSAITGVPSMCIGYTTSLADATPGGTWSSSNTAVATVNSSGVVTSVSVGTTVISYTMPSTGCTATINVAVTNVPSVFAVTGGGSYCSGGTSSVTVGLAGSSSGINYTLFSGTTPIASLIGAGFPFTFPPVSTAGTYAIIAANGTPCSTTMSGTATVSINPLPTQFAVSASNGGAYCAGGAGVNIFLSSSQIGVNYQLFLGATPVGSVVPGTSAALNFGAFTSAGVYSVVGSNTTTLCSGGMANTITVTINPLPTAFTVSPGTGGYCTGGSGVNVTLSGSQVGVSYQLLISGVATGSPVAGTGSSITFGPQLLGGTYTVLATNTTTGCTNLMNGSSILTVNPFPTVFTVTGGGNICPSGSGVNVLLNGSQVGVNYQLYRGGVLLTGTTYNLAGTGSALDYGAQTIPGSYTVVATNPTTTCGSNMTASANVNLNPAPTPYLVTAPLGTSYCAGGTGVRIGLSGSTIGVNYTLFNGATIIGGLSGTGSALDFGLQTAAGTYTAIGFNTATTCSGPMSSSQTVVVNALPIAYNVTVTGGGVYCNGGTGQVIGVNNSQTGVTYQLFRGTTSVGTPVTGTGGAIVFPAQTIAGSYTVVATNTVTLCTNNMTGSASIIINPAPTAYTVTGGGPYCAGGTGSRIGLGASDIGISYQLMAGSTPVGAPVAGLGGVIDFGFVTAAGTYTVLATNSTTTCTGNMSNVVNVSINSLPAVNNVIITGSSSYCAGGTGVVIGLNGSVPGMSYQLYNGTASSGALVTGTGSALTFGPRTPAGTYTATATDPATGCVSNMTGSGTITIRSVPTVYNVTGGGNYCAGGTGLSVGLSNSQSGMRYQLYNTSGIVTGAVLNGTGFSLDFGLQTTAGSYTVVATDTTSACTSNMSSSANLGINALPTAYVISGGGNYCSGTTAPHIGLSNSTVGVNYQLYNGTSTVGAPIAGTGTSLDLGAQSAAGTYSVVATNTTTGCVKTMTGTTVVGINSLPTTFTVNGGGDYCPGGTGVIVGLAGSVSGTVYQLYRGSSVTGSAVAGSGAALSFGLQTTAGTYTVVATNTGTTCTGPMTGSVTVGISNLPTVYNVTGTSNYCPGAAGSHVGLSGSTTGVTYQLFRAGTAVGSPFTGTGSALDFGLQTIGNYTVVATGVATTCTNNMNGTAVIGISPLPTLHTVTGGGYYCTGSTGVHVGLDASDVSIWYQLYRGATPVGSPMAGTGASLDFGLQTAAGVYTVAANSTSTTCTSGMTGSVTVGVNALPSVFNITGGGNYCVGGTGVGVMLSGSVIGVNYQLYRGSVAVGSPMAGTGSSLDFGLQTATGNYMVIATDATTTCTNNMNGTANVNVNPLPAGYLVTGGGNFCAGGTGVHVSIAGSDIGTTYQLFKTGTAVSGIVSGTGLAIDFGLQTAAGSYTVVASNTSTTCSGNMIGSVNVNVNPAPTAYVLSGSSSSFCAGGAGIDITLSGSDLGTSYQLYNGATPVGGSVAGTSAMLDFGYRTATGSYTVVAVNSATGCTGNMTGTASVAISPLPVAFTTTGGGNYCAGGSGVHVGLSGSNVGVLYQLYKGTALVGSSVAGTGGALDFGSQTAAGNYTIVATNPASTCNNNMAGSANITVNALPGLYTVTGGGNYCATGTGVHVGLSGSVAGITYQLYRSGAIAGTPVSGTGGVLDFGLKTTPGTYTVIATSNATGCTNNMSGAATVAVTPLPTAFAVTGGGNYCPGGTGVHVGLDNSSTGVNYQLFRGGTLAGAAVAGTGAGLDFGLQTVAGTYVVVASAASSSCNSNMAGSASVVVNTLPTAYTVVGGGNFCSGAAGVHVGLANSDAGISYQAYNSLSIVGTPVFGTGGPLDLGAETIAGTYTVIATDPTTSCSNAMTGGVDVSVTTSVVPVVTVNSGTTNLCSGTLTNFSAVTTNGGTAPAYQWKINGVIVGTANHYDYIPVNGDVISVTLTSNATCATPSVVTASNSLTVNVAQTPAVTIAANPGTEVCQGTMVNFNASPVGGGSAPVYSWIKNGTNVGSSATYSYIPANGDMIYCIMSSNYSCRTANTGTSSQLNMTVAIPSAPSVTVSVQPGTQIAAGQSATFTATVANAGTAPTFQWFINNVAVSGATLPVFTSTSIGNMDEVSCEVTSSGACSGIVGTSSVVMHVSGVGVKPVVFAGSDIKLIPNPNNGIFTIKGSISATSNENIFVEVTNVIGQVVYKGNIVVHNGEINERIQLNNLANGMYLLNLRSESDTKVFHLVIEQ